MASIEQIAHRMAAPIPRPARPKPKAQKSWRTLQAGQRLLLLEPIYSGGQQFLTGSLWEVTNPTNLGVTLKGLTPDNQGATLSWNETEWKATFHRVPKPRSKKRVQS